MAKGDKAASGNVAFTENSIEGVRVVGVKSYGDEHGCFMEPYKHPGFAAGGIDCEFVQDSQSCSTKGVLRGLHFQIEHPQAKFVRTVFNEVFDVAGDLREGGATYGKWEDVILPEKNKRQFSISHGLLVLSDAAEFCCKCDNAHHQNDEGGLMWDDLEIGIE